MPELSLKACLPWAGLSGGHLQTLCGHLWPSPVLANPGTKLEIPLEDGDRLLTYYHEGPGDLVVSLYHGLSGDIDSSYMHRTALLCQSLGLTCVRVNHRGAGEGHGLAKLPYHSGRGGDVAAVVKYLRHKFPNKKQVTIGYSMSGNILLSLLCGLSGAELPDAAIVVNGAIHLHEASVRLKQGLNRIYDLSFVRDLKAAILEKQKIGLASQDLVIPSFTTVYDLDQLYTAAACGFADREDYYSRCSTKDHVGAIRTPTYVLTAANDPFIPVRDYLEARWSSAVNLRIEKSGGHLGYLSGGKTPLGSHRWLDYYLHEALQALH